MPLDILGRSHTSHNIKGTTVLAVVHDQQDSQNVIVTGKNDIKLYKPDSRCLVKSWSCQTWKQARSACVNTDAGRYYCQLQSKSILSWSYEENELDNIRPVKLPASVHSLLGSCGKVFVAFNSGYIEEISSALGSKTKEKPQLINSKDTIIEVYIRNSSAVIATSEKGDASCPDKIYLFEVGATDPGTVESFSLSRPNLHLKAFCFTTRLSVITLWNNGDLCQSHLPLGWVSSLSRPGLRMSPIGNCSSVINHTKSVRIIQTTSNHFAVVGKDAQKDGGLISLWDMDLSIEVTKRGFKMFHPPLKCWSLLDAEEANVGGLLLAEGAHITVVPVVKLPPPGLLQLFQDQDPIENAKETLDVRNWNVKGTTSKTKQEVKNPKKRVNGIHKSLDKLLSNQENLKENNIDFLISKHKLGSVDELLCVKTLVDVAVKEDSPTIICDILRKYKQMPESSIVQLLSYILQCSDETLKSLHLQDLTDFWLRVSSKETPFDDVVKGKKKKAKIKRSKKKKFSNGDVHDWKKANGHLEDMDVSVCDMEVEEQASSSETNGKLSNGDYLILKILSFPVVQSTLILELKKQLHFRDAIKILDLLTSLLERFNLDALSHAAGDVLRVPTFVQAVSWIIVLTDAHISAFELEQQLNSIRFTTNCKRLLVERMEKFYDRVNQNIALVNSLLDPDNHDEDLLNVKVGDNFYSIDI